MLGREVVRQLSGAALPICLGRVRPQVETELEFIKADLCDPEFFRFLPRKIDAVVNLAQSEHYADFPNRATDVFRVNVAATAALLQWAQAAGATHFIQASTGGLYGLGPRAFNEADAINIAGRLAFYYSTKYAAEVIVNAYRDCLTIVSLRYFFIYGAHQNRSMLVPRLIDAISNGRPLTLSSESGMRLNPIDVSDAAAATAPALTIDKSMTINVAGPDVVSMLELGHIIASALGKSLRFEQTSDVAGQDLVADITLMSSCLGAPRTGVRSGIASICAASNLSQC
jgi:nucleoside-diphosphate-sugar epimerase